MHGSTDMVNNLLEGLLAGSSARGNADLAQEARVDRMAHQPMKARLVSRYQSRVEYVLTRVLQVCHDNLA